MLQTVWKWLSRVLGVHREGDRSMHSNRLLPDTTQQKISEHDTSEHDTSEHNKPGLDEESLFSNAAPSERSQGHADRTSQADYSAEEAQISRPQKESLSLQAAETTESAQLPQSEEISAGAAEPPPELLRRCNEQEARIDSLRQQLKELRPTATIGEAWLKRGQASAASSFIFSNQASQSHHVRPDLASSREHPLNLQDRLIRQDEIIAGLEHDVKEAQRLSTIGEARLNRWRHRTFSS